jgi:hypothetical protein
LIRRNKLGTPDRGNSLSRGTMGESRCIFGKCSVPNGEGLKALEGKSGELRLSKISNASLELDGGGNNSVGTLQSFSVEKGCA